VVMKSFCLFINLFPIFQVFIYIYSLQIPGEQPILWKFPAEKVEQVRVCRRVNVQVINHLLGVISSALKA
jgi:hypothetical protein